MSKKSKVGVIEWRDLTVDNAEQVKNFYSKVVGWNTSAASMGDYDDYNVNLPHSDETIAGICHARGSNAKIPAQWLMYVRVESVQDSVKQCIDLGGAIIDGPRKQFGGIFCVIQDPAGAILALLSD